jgi:hypothetical protein
VFHSDCQQLDPQAADQQALVHPGLIVMDLINIHPTMTAMAPVSP